MNLETRQEFYALDVETASSMPTMQRRCTCYVLVSLYIRVNEIMVCDIYISLTHIYRYDISVYPAIKVNNNSVFYEHLQFIHTNKTDDMYQTVSSS